MRCIMKPLGFDTAALKTMFNIMKRHLREFQNCRWETLNGQKKANMNF
jgi:hypothetical protein